MVSKQFNFIGICFWKKVGNKDSQNRFYQEIASLYYFLITFKAA